jgi:predicted transcriptional regulator
VKVSDLTIEEFEELLRKTIEDEIEDLYIMLEPTIKAKIEEGLADIREGKVVSLDDLIARRQAKRGEV